MNKSSFKKLLVIFICTVFIFALSSEVIIAKEYFRTSNNNIESVEKLLKLDEDVDLNSSKKVNVIVHFDEKYVYEYIKDNDIKEKFIEEMNKNKVDEADIIKLYEKVFNGAVVSIPANRIKQLLKVPMIKNIYSDCEVKIKPLNTKSTLKENSKLTNSILMENINKLHGEGIKGKNIKIGILDTGIDYNHPEVKSSYKGGYDFIDNDNDPMETTYEQWKSSKAPEYDEKGENTYYTTHGTHVAGIIAGQGLKGQAALGAAPESEIYAYRVLGPYGVGTMESIISGVEKAVKDGMDILNLSLGIDVNDPLYPTSIAINNAVNLGTVVVAASGNNGSEPYTISTPGNSPLGITVGASNNDVIIPTVKGNFSSLHENSTLALLSKDKIQNLKVYNKKNLNVVYCGYGVKEDFNGKELKNSIALVRRGKNPLMEKGKNAKEKGAVFTIVINDNESENYIPMYFGESEDYSTIFTLPYKDGQAILSMIEERKVDFKISNFSKFEITKGVLLDFSSRGPVKDTYIIKPDIVAPGANILSSVPRYFKGKDMVNYEKAYEIESGTSMAAAYVTGVAALILDKNPDYSPYDVKAALMNTASDLEYNYSVYEIGSGMINPYRAVHSKIKFQILDKTTSLNENHEKIQIESMTSSLNFNENIKNQTGRTKNIKISNNSALNKEFKIDIKSLKNKEGNIVKYNELIHMDESVVINSMESKVMAINLDVVESSSSDYYEGYIIFTNKNDLSERYQIPFAYIKG
ncbi:MAG: S8 family serine peptidase [Clostridium argentinense]|uniref:S8 family serine peptidase n=1 Tax=Clostridium faecium TaxID=2762223 RepID=A0ABR8YTW0_9CLOT|nr:S8 family serine peptidase [Clostridium faecium]MBD8047629.1 S8 family serine peptidase [Clostridium faecium]MBS5823266.1 S8 family serine peptidase [Clostridium argentinense]